MGIEVVNDGDLTLYANEFGEQWEGSKNFYFALADINNDGNQNLRVSYEEENSLFSINGVNPSEGTYLCKGGSIFAIADLYVYDGTIREISEEKFYSIWNDWDSKHTDFSADIHLDIKNIENTFQVKIDVQSSGEWLVENAE